MPDQNIGRVDVDRREQRVQPAGNLISGYCGAAVLELRALTKADAIVEYDACEGCNRARDRSPGRGVVAEARLEDDRGAGLAARFNGDNKRVVGRRHDRSEKNENSRQQWGNQDHVSLAQSRLRIWRTPASPKVQPIARSTSV